MIINFYGLDTCRRTEIRIDRGQGAQLSKQEQNVVVTYISREWHQLMIAVNFATSLSFPRFEYSLFYLSEFDPLEILISDLYWKIQLYVGFQILPYYYFEYSLEQYCGFRILISDNFQLKQVIFKQYCNEPVPVCCTIHHY